MSEERSATQAKLTSREEFRFLTDLVLKHSTGEHTFVALQDVYSGTTRFANNQMVQNVNVRRASLAVTVAFGQQHGTASTTDLTAGAVRETGLGWLLPQRWPPTRRQSRLLGDCLSCTARSPLACTRGADPAQPKPFPDATIVVA